MAKQVIGGGAKKVLYTLNTIRRVGPAKAAKALSAHNTCKACALGMGGQHGGMTNELGEFPSVCNKSVQAQSTDIQPAIPLEVFKHDIDDLDALSAKEIEHLGRLTHPIVKRADSDRFHPVEWEEAMTMMADRFAETDPDRSFFYSSGRSSNEAGFLFQLLARVYGTNNVTNCSYYCHQATSVALDSTIGTGTATVELADLKKSDLAFVIGANPSSNHPRFIHLLKSVRDRGGQVIVINPAKEPGLVKFAVPKSPKSMMKGGDEIASFYLQPNIGEDIALFKGLGKAILEKGYAVPEFISDYTEGFEDYSADLAALSWDEITRRCGITHEQIEHAAEIYAKSERAVFAWGMGMTHHSHGVENIEYISNLALLRGMVGKTGAGLLPLRGHSNVQGIGTIGVKPVLADEILDKMEASFNLTLPKKQGLDTLASLHAASRGEIDAALVMGGNLHAATPHSHWAADALNRIGFKAFLTTTLNKGHIAAARGGDILILPVTARDEEPQSTTQESMFNFVRLSDGGIKRHANLRSEIAILADLGARLRPHGPIDFAAFERHDHIRDAIAAIVPGMAELKDISVAKREFHIAGRIKHSPEFGTPSGKASFRTHALPATAGIENKRPFTLATIRSEGQFNSIIYEEHDSYRQTKTRNCVMMNAQDIERLGIGKDALVTVTSDQGEMRDVKVDPFDVPSGNILAYYPEANVLTPLTVDPRSKTPAFKSVMVDIALG